MENEEDSVEYLDEERTNKLREIIYMNFHVWKLKHLRDNDYIDHLCYLLGKRDVNELRNCMTAKDERIIHALAGPNSYAVYKMLLLKKEK